MDAKSGQIFVAQKSRGGVVKHKFYLYNRGELKTYTTRSVTCLANGDELLETPGLLERAWVCPFCQSQIWDPERGEVMPDHDGVRCAHKWDARVKNYCADCGADLERGKCPRCEESGARTEPRPPMKTE